MRFELALLVDRDVNEPVALADLLDLADRHEPLPEVRPDDATLLFESDGVDRMPVHWVLGDLGALGHQFAAAAARLRSGDIAIVRSAVDDRVDVTSLLVEPAGHEAVVSEFRAPPVLRYVYPTAPARGGELYDYVRAHRHDLLADHTADPHRIVGVTVRLGDMIDALDREADRAARAVRLLDS